MRNLIRSRLPRGNYDLPSIASELGREKRTLQRQLQLLHNTSYSDLLREVRVELAKKFLEDTSLPVTQLAYTLGFADPANMTRSFKQAVGITPKDWRQSHRVS